MVLPYRLVGLVGWIEEGQVIPCCPRRDVVAATGRVSRLPGIVSGVEVSDNYTSTGNWPLYEKVESLVDARLSIDIHKGSIINV
jgi:hypothetical protein